jgi:hypothetical protein
MRVASTGRFIAKAATAKTIQRRMRPPRVIAAAPVPPVR